MNLLTKLDAKPSIAAMRSTLRKAFPKTKFSVTMGRGTAYGSAYVDWTDGPTREEVESVTDCYEAKGFDGSDDSTLHFDKTIEVNGERFLSGVGLVILQRGCCS